MRVVESMRARDNDFPRFCEQGLRDDSLECPIATHPKFGCIPDTHLFQFERPTVVDVWAAAGSVDTDLSFLSFLELYGTEIAERRMPARRVVEALDVVEHI